MERPNQVLKLINAHITTTINHMIKKFIEVPNTNIKEPVLNNQWADELCLQIADDYGYAEIVWYALNGKRVVEGNYGDPSLVGMYEDVRL